MLEVKINGINPEIPEDYIKRKVYEGFIGNTKVKRKGEEIDLNLQYHRENGTVIISSEIPEAKRCLDHIAESTIQERIIKTINSDYDLQKKRHTHRNLILVFSSSLQKNKA